MLTLDPTHTLSSLRSVKVGKPDNATGSMWKGVRHYDLVAGLIKALEPNDPGYEIVLSGVNIVLSRNDADMIGTIQVSGNSHRQTHLGFSASNAGRKSLQLYVGGTWNNVPLVMQEFGGKERFHGWTYDINFRLQDVCEEMVAIWRKEIEAFPDFAAELFSKKLSNPRVSNIIADAAEKKIIPWRGSAPSIWSDWKRKVTPESKNAGVLMGLFAEHGAGYGLAMDNLHNTLTLGKMVNQKVQVPV